MDKKNLWIASFALTGLVVHLALRWILPVDSSILQIPLWLVLALGGLPLCLNLIGSLLRGEFGSDLLAGISIVTSVLLGEYLAGAVIVLMLSGGEALEAYAVGHASAVLSALAKRMPTRVHRKSNAKIEDVDTSQLAVGEEVVVFPHEICPVDGVVVEGRGAMDESFLTGEPYQISKTPGSHVISGAINGESALTIRAERSVADSRYANIMKVMEQSAQTRPKLRRLGDQLGAFYTPLAIAIGLLAWYIGGTPIRFLAVMVVATPCPLLIAIPIAIIGSVSLAAKRAIIVRDPTVLEKLPTCRTIILDKTGTLTYGRPQLENQNVQPGFNAVDLLGLVASLEAYSKHPLATAIVEAGQNQGLAPRQVSSIAERPGAGLQGIVDGRELYVTSRKAIASHWPQLAHYLPPRQAGLECVVLVDGDYAATYHFRDTPRPDGRSFIQHLMPSHSISRTLLVSGDRREEVEYLANLVGMKEIHSEKSPEEKLAIVRRETELTPTIYVGDGINDAPALLAATVGIAFGHNSDITSEAAGAVIMDSSLAKVDEILHIGRRMRNIALQSAVGGMALSFIGMMAAVFGYLSPVNGAICQELIDILAVMNALRVAVAPKNLSDYQ